MRKAHTPQESVRCLRFAGFALLGFAGVALLSACGGESPRVVAPPPTVAVPPPAGPIGAAGSGESRSMTRKLDLVETLHGTRVADPYRWLEDGDSPEVRAWTERQNAATRTFIDGIAGRADLERDVKKLLQIGYVSAPASYTTKAGTKRYFHTKREGTQNQPTLYVRDGVNGVDRVLIDASGLSDDGTTALDWWYPSWDGRFVAWGRSESGSEESTLFVRDVTTGKDLADKIDRTRHASLAWMPDGKSFYYSRYPEPGTVPAGDEKYFAKIFHHVIGQDPKTDKLVFGEGRDKTDIPTIAISPNGRWLIGRIHMGWDKSEVYLKDLAKGANAANAPWIPVAVKTPAIFEPIPRNDRLYIQTNDGAPRYKLYAVSYDKPERAAWKEVLAEGQDVLDDVAILKNEIVATFMHDAATRVERFGLDGRSKGPVELPGIGSAGATGAWDGEEAFISYSSYVVPPQALRLDLRARTAAPVSAAGAGVARAAGPARPAGAASPVPAGGSSGAPVSATPKLELWDKVGAEWSANDIEVQRLYATSKDGTKVPLFVISKKGLRRDGNNPTVLYGYGGFNVNQTPAFSPRALASVQQGAVWVVAILRGGGELGESWHKGGMLDKKQNVFDDFYASAEMLVREKITNPDRLGIMGGSNGGLLVATAVTQRPELFRVGLSLVPLTDMVRYHRFRIAKLWISEYGDPDKQPDFDWLYAYSPYHHVREGVRYPAMLFTTAESDSRVDPMHARKMAARMQEVQRDPERPILIRVETKAGHGAGKPVTKLAVELADELSFLLRELGVMQIMPRGGDARSE